MPRPRKCRRIGFMPENTGFEPHSPAQGFVEMLEEEIEALRLSDFLALEQTARLQRLRPLSSGRPGVAFGNDNINDFIEVVYPKANNR